MLSPQALIRGLVSRALPTLNPDGPQNDVALRLDAYGGLYSQPMVRKAHALADEGSYFLVNNAQTGIAPTYNTSFTAGSPYIIINNNNAVGPNAPRVYVDYVALVAIVAGAQTTTAGYIACAVQLDSGNRFSSGGSNLTANVVNSRYTLGNNSGVNIYCGALATTTAVALRTLVGVRNLRPSVSTTVMNVVGDMHLLNFGGVEGAVGSITIANANIMPQAFPALIIEPQQSALINLWFPVMSAPSAATFAPEIGFWVR